MLYSDSLFGSFPSREALVGSLRQRYPRRAFRHRFVAQVLAAVWPTDRLCRCLAACREIRDFERGR